MKINEVKILEQILDTVEDLRQRSGQPLGRGHLSSLQRLRNELEHLGREIEWKRLKGRALRRKSGELFRRIVSLFPEIWSH